MNWQRDYHPSADEENYHIAIVGATRLRLAPAWREQPAQILET
jgi:hypothetical protein